MERAAQNRVAGVGLVLENLFDPGNRAAILRTAEALGLLRVQIVGREQARKFQARRVSRGAERWLQIWDCASPREAIARCRHWGHRVWAATPTGAYTIDSLPLTGPVSLVFGAEHDGVSRDMLDACDGTFRIPMAGTTESLNVSIAAAIAMHHTRHRWLAQQEQDINTDLTAAQRLGLVQSWMDRQRHGQRDTPWDDDLPEGVAG
jgi:tRNA (guanosine-2'-O-)-methyltransferase